MAGLYFEEFVVGRRFEHEIRRTVTDFERVCDEAALPTGLRAELRGQFQPLLTRRQSTRPMINLKPYVFADSEQNISRYFPDGRYRLYVHRPRGPGDPAGEVTGDTRRFIRHEHPELEYADIGYKISASRTRRRSALANLSNAPLTDTQVHDLRRLVTDPRALDVRDQVTARLNAYARSAGNEDYLVQAGSCRGMITRPTRRA